MTSTLVLPAVSVANVSVTNSSRGSFETGDSGLSGCPGGVAYEAVTRWSRMFGA